jgi:type VI secretion system secreted protein VgrG
MIDDHVSVRLESDAFACDHVEVHRLAGRETISELFSFDLEIVSRQPDEPTVEAMSGADATLVFERRGEVIRRVHGMIAEVGEHFESEVETRAYTLRFVPRMFRLTLVQTQEIYMDMSIQEIILQKLEQVGLGSESVQMRLLGSYPKLEFVVQYKETDLAFVSRLTEHVGVSFFFEHDDERDVVVFTDYKEGFHPAPFADKVPFEPRGDRRNVYRVDAKTSLIPATYVLQDYNYRTPHVDLTAAHDSPVGFAGGVIEYGAHFKTVEAGQELARIRAEEHEARRHVYQATSDACQLGAGATFTIDGHPRLDAVPLLVVEIEHHLTQVTVMHGGGAEAYRNELRAIDARLTYRPPRRTPKPKIHGLVTGIVEHDALAEIKDHARLDEQGRYTVRFLLDTAPPGQRRASRPVRMLQPNAGPAYGIHFPLRPGIEVLLGFVDGDPDRPLIVGAVSNPETPSPVTAQDPLLNRIKTASGLMIEMKDS